MIRHGVFTIGVAVQAETFTNSPTQQNNSSSTSSPTSTASKSAIFLAPSNIGSGGPQSLRITFAYNKDTNLPEVLINLNEGDGEEYLKLKPLKANKGFGKGDISHNLPNNSIDISKALQVYCFEEMESPSSTQVFEVLPQDKSHNPQKNSPSDIKNKGDRKGSFSETNSQKTSDSSNNLSKEDNPTKSEMEAGARNLENIQSSSVLKVSDASNHEAGLEGEKAEDNQNKNDKGNPEKKTPSPKSNKEKSNKSSPKSNGRLVRRKSKSRVLIQEREGTSPGSPTKGISDKSKIPFINSAATGFMPCEYYRQKWLQENGCTDPATWNDYSNIQKTAGQKVINKMTAQQKKLEEDAIAQKKRTEFIFHEDLGSVDVAQNIIPIRKKQTRLQPLPAIPKCH